jgi:cell division inhibitor SepF
MSALHRLKAYFGMVPAEELDYYGSDYGPDYGGNYPDYRDYEDYPPERPLRRPRRPDEHDAWGRYRRADDTVQGMQEPELAAVRTARRPGWASDNPAAQVRGSLAVDTAPALRDPAPRYQPYPEEDGHSLGRIVTLHPRTYNDARQIGERYREGTPVIMNLTEMDDADARRLVDFAAGLAFALRGSIDKVTTKVFLLSPTNVDVTAEDKRRIAEGGFFSHS